MRYGTPFERARRQARAATALRACSYCLCTMALMAGLTCSARAIAVSSTSAALTSRLAIKPGEGGGVVLAVLVETHGMSPRVGVRPGGSDTYNDRATSSFMISVVPA